MAGAAGVAATGGPAGDVAQPPLQSAMADQLFRLYTHLASTVEMMLTRAQSQSEQNDLEEHLARARAGLVQLSQLYPVRHHSSLPPSLQQPGSGLQTSSPLPPSTVAGYTPPVSSAVGAPFAMSTTPAAYGLGTAQPHYPSHTREGLASVLRPFQPHTMPPSAAAAPAASASNPPPTTSAPSTLTSPLASSVALAPTGPPPSSSFASMLNPPPLPPLGPSTHPPPHGPPATPSVGFSPTALTSTTTLPPALQGPPSLHPPSLQPPSLQPPNIHQPSALHPPPALQPPALHPPALQPPSIHPPATFHPTPPLQPPSLHPPPPMPTTAPSLTLVSH